MFSFRRWLHFHSNQDQNLGLYPKSPVLSKPVSHFISSLLRWTFKHKKKQEASPFYFFCFYFFGSILAQSSVHPEPDSDRKTMGERHSQPLSVFGYYYFGAHIRLSETSWQVNPQSELYRNIWHDLFLSIIWTYRNLPGSWNNWGGERSWTND